MVFITIIIIFIIIIAMKEHEMSIAEVIALHKTDAKAGLSENEAQTRLQQFGQNMLTPPKEKVDGDT